MRIPATTGRVINASTRRPVPAAQVVVCGHPETVTSTDNLGRFTTRVGAGHQFTFVGSGYDAQRYHLTVTREGFTPAKLPWIRPPMFGLNPYPGMPSELIVDHVFWNGPSVRQLVRIEVGDLMLVPVKEVRP